MDKHTLYITFDGLSDPLGQSQILPYLTGISKAGYQITILSCEKSERLNKEKTSIENQLKACSISWKYIIYNEQGNFLSRFQYIQKLSHLAEKENSEKKFALVHCRSYLSSLIGLKLKRKHNIPFLFDMRGFWANERLDGNIWDRSNPLHVLFYKYFKLKEKQFLRHSNAIVSLTQAALKHLTKTFPDSQIEKKTAVIPCCVNTQLFSPSAVPENNPVAGISKNDHVLIYTGSIGTWYFTKEMIDCVLAWKSFMPNIKLLIVTRDVEELQKILSAYPEDVKQMIVTASSSYSQMPYYLSLANASIFFIKPAFSKMASSPTKMAECWAMNLPIITNSGIGDNDLLFSENKGGVLIKAFNHAAYIEAYKTYEELLKSKNDYRQIALNHFDTQKAIASYTSVYHSLTKS